MRTGIVAFLAGNMALLYWPYFPNIHFIYILFGIVLILTGVLYRLRDRYVFVKKIFFPATFPTILLILGCCSGALWTVLYIECIERELDLRQLEGQTIQVTGQIVSLPEKDAKKTQFEFAIYSRNLGAADNSKRHRQDSGFKGKVRLSWYGPSHKVEAGQYWQLDIRLKNNNGLMNPGGFDYEQWLFQHHIQATGYIRKGQILQDEVSSFDFNGLRQALDSRLDTALQDNPYKGLFKALAIGSRADISTQQWQLLFRTGTNHLMAISGLHIGLLAALSGFLVFALWSRISYLNLKLPAVIAASVAGLLMAFFYAALAGFAIPTQRALIMLIVVFVAIISSRSFMPDYVLLWALWVVLLFDPLSSLSSGFWLSFCAVAVIILSVSFRLSAYTDKKDKVIGFFKIQQVLFIGLLPAMAVLFHQLSITSPVANLLAVPLMSLLIVPATLGAALTSLIHTASASMIFEMLVLPLDVLFWLLNELGSWSFSLYYLPRLSFLSFVSALAASLWLLMPKGWPGRWLGLLLLLPVLFTKADRPLPGELRLTMLDVGQGLSMAIQTREHTMIFDTGDNYSRQFNMADSVIIPFLRYRGISKIDRLIISHTDKDHSGSLKPLYQGFKVNELSSGEAQSSLFSQYRVQQCQKGQQWLWDDVRFEILSPQINRDAQTAKNNNNRSCVLLITTKDNTRYLLTGDIEKQVERQLLKHYPALKVNVLQVPHHGSNTSSGMTFINQLEPELALFSYGYRNRFRHPSEQVVQRYQKKAVKIYTTANGAIDIKRNITNNSFLVIQYRLQNKRFWHRKAEDF